MCNLQVGVVVIGRNEGERLKRCLQSILLQTATIIYVDSGSSDDSVVYARSLGLETLALDMRFPFSAARARNAGCQYFFRILGHVQYVQFIDGDCELCEGWLAAAKLYLDSNPSAAIVAGRLKERFPERSIYNSLCDIEWDTPEGEASSCGGIFMVRSNAFRQVSGFNESVVAGEEPELCYRLRQLDWKICRLGGLMALHDSDMTKFSQWWKRTMRSGYAYAQGCALHGHDSEHFRVRECLRIWLWSILLPGVSFAGGCFITPWFLLLLLLYPLQVVRVMRKSGRRSPVGKIALIYAIQSVFDKWPQFCGQLLFLKNKMAGHASTIIEYK